MSEPVPAPPMGQLSRLTGVLFDPKPAFAGIAARPSGWWWPLLLLVVLSLGITAAYTQRVGWERFMRQQIESSPRTQQLSAEQKEQIIEQQTRFAPYIGVVFSLSPPVAALVIAGAFLFVFNVLLGTQVTFKQYYAAVSYGFMPGFVSGLLALALMFIKDPADYDLQNPVASNLAAFLDPNTTPKWLLGTAQSFDLFNIWMMLLMATGIAAAARRLSWAKAFTWVALTWAVWLVGKGLLSWIFS